jgi:hypothetical protein
MHAAAVAEPADTEDVPHPHPALSVVGTLIDVLVEDMPRKRRARFLRKLEERAQWLAESQHPVRLRSAALDRQAATAHRQALAWVRRMRAAWFSRPR